MDLNKKFKADGQTHKDRVTINKGFKVGQRIRFHARPEDGVPTETAVIIYVEDQDEHPGMFIAEIPTILREPTDPDGLREAYDDDDDQEIIG